MKSNFDKAILRFEEFVLSFSVILMAILLIVGVFMRTVMNSSLTFTEEVGSALLIVISFFGLGYCAKKGRHITMSIIFDMVGNKYKKIFMIVISLVSALATAYISYLAFRYVISVQNLGRVTPALQIPMYLIYSVVPLGFVLAAIEYLMTFVKNIKDKDNFYLTSEIMVPIDSELKGDLSNIINKLSDDEREEEK